ncbi:MAG: signal peptidase II [Saprospiraceae bacterium]|nr:signal peptidase II [Saprospiraceae bacterium]
MINNLTTRILIVLAIVFLNVGCDQVTKQVAVEELSSGTIKPVLGDFFRLSYAENKGAFLSWGAEWSKGFQTFLLHFLPVVLLVGLLGYTFFSKQLSHWQIIAFSFIIGGGVSNIYDRLLYGRVVDFMNMGIGDLRTGIFNFADVSIMIGLFILLPFIFKQEPEVAHPE